MDMSDHTETPLDDFIIQLLAAGAVLSQMIGHMMKSQATTRRGDLDTVPIPEIAHKLIREVIQPPMRAFSPTDLRRAAKLVETATDELVEQILFVPISSGEPELN